MKTTLKVALLASVLMASPVLAADTTTTTTTDDGHTVTTTTDANGKPMMHKHWHHKKMNGDTSMDDPKYVNHDANPNYAADKMHRGYRDADGNWHDGNGQYVTNGYRDANGNWHNGMRNGANPEYRDYGYNDYYNRNGQRKWMGMNLETRHMSDGSDTDQNNRGRHAFIFDNGQNAQDFRVGSGHVVKF